MRRFAQPFHNSRGRIRKKKEVKNKKNCKILWKIFFQEESIFWNAYFHIHEHLLIWLKKLAKSSILSRHFTLIFFVNFQTNKTSKFISVLNSVSLYRSHSGLVLFCAQVPLFLNFESRAWIMLVAGNSIRMSASRTNSSSASRIYEFQCRMSITRMSGSGKGF